ncbi:HAD hydrolase family protein [Alphaproteobacteria bacterium]|nr:HAD hydrolase family protein [Alphaproteobacteria bacterium]
MIINYSTDTSVIIMTDLDGTLLDFNTFGFDPIRPVIEELLESGIVIIPNSSKTNIEIDNFCNLLGVKLPYICENGASLCNANLIGESWDILNNHTIIKGRGCTDLMETWLYSIDNNLRQQCYFLTEMGTEQQSDILGLTGKELDCALTRQFTCPFIFNGTDDDYYYLQIQAKTARLNVQKGGRICQLSGEHNKASFNQLLRDYFSNQQQKTIILAFGDSYNDVSMLEAADIACIIPQPAQPALILPTPPKKVFTATTAAPDGWLEALPNALKYLENFNIERHNHG